MTVPAADLRIYIVFRANLPEMTRAKGEVQAAHAVGSLIFKWTVAGGSDCLNVLADYFGALVDFAPDGKIDSHQPKVCMEVDDLLGLRTIKERAFRRKVLCIEVTDAAHTVFNHPTVTCLAFGPCSKTDGNAITRGARMRV